MRTFSVSIDTEDFLTPHSPCDLIFGRIGRRELGIPLIMDMCEKRGIKATFFVDVFNACRNISDDMLKDACQEIKRRGHEVALHTHPPKGGNRNYDSWFASATGYMANYDLQSQIELLHRGIDKMVSWTGITPVSHRAGAYGINADTFHALEASGVFRDSSIFWGLQSDLPETRANNLSPFKIGRVFEIPVTSYRLVLQGLGTLSLNKKLDVSWSPTCELSRVINLDLPHVDLFLHSYSLIDLKKGEPYFHFIENFEKILDELIQSRIPFTIAELPELDAAFAGKPTVSMSLYENTIEDLYHFYARKVTLKKIKKLFSGDRRIVGY